MRFFTQTTLLARRSLKNMFSNPAGLIPSLIFPLLFMAVSSAGASEAAKLPGFPAESFLQFFVAGALVQGMVFSGIGAGTALAVDIELGFIRRLLLTPLYRPVVLIAASAGAVGVGVMQTIVLLIGGIAGGADVEGGIAGIAGLIALSVLVSLAFSSVGILIAVWTGSSEQTQIFFPMFFVMVIFSSYFMPRTYLTGWFKAVATYNPVTYVIEMLRSLIVPPGFDGRALGLGLAAAVGICVFGFGGAAALLSSRLGRT